MQMYFGPLGGFIGVINTSEILNLAGAGFFIQPLRVAFFSGFQTAINEDLDKGHIVGFVELPHYLAVDQIGADKAAEYDHTAIDKKL